ncbi:HNH endonuclease [Bradyrhizobium sp. HKCCYLR1051]|uniref:HNH endonuclease n=1 Tax=Bradyrhizobium sp. HKCCYLR1051 TaxID=3420738 RepID=UPI003EB986DA
MVRIRKLSPLVPKGDGRTVAVAPKRADPELLTAEHRAWAECICTRAGWRCEWIEDGQRCQASRATGQRMVADHIVERADGGRTTDANGQCLCVAHNTKKGIQARQARAKG